MTEEEKRRRLQAYALQNFTGQLKVQDTPQASKVTVAAPQPQQQIRQAQPTQFRAEVTTPYRKENFVANQPQPQTGAMAFLGRNTQPIVKSVLGTNQQGDNRNFLSKAWDQVNQMDSGRSFRQNTPTTKDSGLTQYGKAVMGPLAGVQLRGFRTIGGAAEGASGLVDWVTPGTGTSRVTQGISKFNANLDKTAKDVGGGATYKIAEVPAEVASFFVPGKALVTGAKFIPGGLKAIKATDRALDTLGSKGGKVGKAITGSLKPTEAFTEAAITGKYIGEDVSKGREITPQRVAVDIFTGIGGDSIVRVVNSLRRLKIKNVDDLALEKDAGKIEEAIIRDAPEIPADKAKDISIKLAEADTPEKVSGVLAAAKTDLATPTPQAQVLGTPSPSITDDVATQLSKSSNPEEVKLAVRALLPEIPDNQLSDLSSKLSKTTDVEETKRLVEEARAKTEKEALAKIESQTANEQTLEQAVEPQTAPQTMDTTEPVGAPVQGAQTNVPGATTVDNVPGSAPPTPPSEGTDLGSYINNMAESQGINTEYQAPKLFAFNRLLNAVTGGRIQNLMQISPFRKAAQGAENVISSQAQKANVSKRGSKILNTARLGFAQTGMSDVVRMAARKFRDAQSLAGDMIKGEMKIMDNLIKNLADKEQSLDNIYRVIADNDILARTHGDGARLSLDDLTPEERVIADRIINAQKMTNEINYKIGKITKEQYEAEKETGHYARMFNIESKKGKSLGKKPIDTKPFVGQKDASEFSDSLMEMFVKDPSRGALARQEIALRSLASHEFMGDLVSQGRLLQNRPNKGFQQLTGKKFGQFEGMWADNTTRSQIKQNMEFNTDFAKKYVGELLDDFKSSPLGKTQRVLKATKTVLNPGTNVQNILSNVLLFNRGAGVGMIRNVMGMTRAAKDLTVASKKGLTAELIQAKKLGVFGSDSGKAMTGDIGAEDLASIPGKKNIVTKGLNVAENAYGGADNAAKLALWRNLQRKGLSPEDAALQVQKFTQDYHNVGRIVGAMADAPILGKPFARFIPELIRLSKNNIIYNPAGTIASLAALAYTGNALSERAGESDEDRKNREEAAGNTSIPGTSLLNKTLGGPDRNISLNFALGDSSINIARAIGLNFPVEPGQDPNRALLEQLLPFEVPTRKDAQGNEVFDITKVITNLGLRPIVEVATDRDFMGRSIQDPENKTYVEGSELGKKYQGEISTGEKAKNVVGHLARAYLPMSNEADSLYSAIKGEPNAMGKEQSVKQAALRVLGLKVEKNDKETREKRASTKQYFEGKVAQVNDFLNKNPDLKDQYLKLKSGTVDRGTGKKVVDLIKPEKWRLIASDKSGRLFEQLKAEDIYQNQQDKSYPIDPIYSDQLSPEQRNQLLGIRSSVTGNNIEEEEILRATQPWYTNFEAAERDHQTKLSAYFDKLKAEGKLKSDTQNERVKAYGELYDKFAPKQTPLMQEYYKTKETDPEGAKDLFDVYPELSDQFAAYKEQKLKYINERRKMEGEPEIDRNTFMNVTFGYEDDERKVYNELKYGKGYGGYSGSKGYSKFGYSKSSRKGGSGGSSGSDTAEKPAKTYAAQLLSGLPTDFTKTPNIDTTPKKVKFKVKTPSGKGRNYKRIRLQ